ncbi:MAG: hypothetical protein Q7U16_16465 [Agitococcus sp.]|nr:hypothetical protein [Agitococcus sp.]
MNVRANPAFTIVSIVKFWPWLAVLSLVVLIVWILRLGSETSSETESVIMATPQSTAIHPTSPQQSTLTHTSLQEASVETAAANQVAYGEVDSAPYSRLPENNPTFNIKERAQTLMTWVSDLISGTPSATSTSTSSVNLATPKSSVITATPSKQALIDTTVDAPVADGEVDPVPVVNHLPVAHGEVRNQDRVHAGDDSMYLKDEGSSSETTESN